MIDILLPVYNGEKYIAEQINSLESQSFKDFRIIIRNDGSNDNSDKLLDAISAKYNNILLVKDNKGNLGLSKTLEILIENSEAEYFMFCDQDDKWMPNKVEFSYKALMELETEHPDLPILVCTDSTCVDDNEKVISQSFFKSQKYEDVTDNTTKLAAMNVVQGNTCIMNSLCKKYILPFPPYVLYDHWCGIMVSHYGLIKYLHVPTLWYRQHQGNVLGANDVGIKYFVKKLLNLKKQIRTYRSLFVNAPFRINILGWMYYKLFFSFKRIMISNNKEHIIQMMITNNCMGGVLRKAA